MWPLGGELYSRDCQAWPAWSSTHQGSIFWPKFGKNRYYFSKKPAERVRLLTINVPLGTYNDKWCQSFSYFMLKTTDFIIITIMDN